MYRLVTLIFWFLVILIGISFLSACGQAVMQSRCIDGHVYTKLSGDTYWSEVKGETCIPDR